MKVYVASTAKDERYALEPENILAVCTTGPSPRGDAGSYAYDYTKAEDLPAYIYAVDVQFSGRYEVIKEVVHRSTPE